MNTKLQSHFYEILQCPKCTSILNKQDNGFICINPCCKTVFPENEGIPILIDEEISIFEINSFIMGKPTFFRPRNKWSKLFGQIIPSSSLNLKAHANFQSLANILIKLNRPVKVLIVGGSILGDGIEPLLGNNQIELVETDISFGPRTQVICDCHRLPFQDEVFDAVVIQAVLEHVVDPYLCVKEIYRVLKKDGLVYAETPFIQQVHGGAYDFTRFTHLGHRRLFNGFSELESGVTCGPGMALAWSYQYFLTSFTESKTIRKILIAFARITSFYLKYFDQYLVNKKGSLDAASGYYFIGQKWDKVLSDKELIGLYKGAL